MERYSTSSPPLGDCVEHVVTKRKGNFDYLKRIHQGKGLWLNTFQLSKSATVGFYGPQKLQKRAHRCLILGMSVAGLLNLPSGAHIVQASAQLMEEFEHFIGHPSGTAKALVSLNFYRSVLAFEPNETAKPAIQKVNKQVCYQYLQLPTICLKGALDYCEVVMSLCDCLTILYSKFLDESCASAAWQQIVLKIDKKIKTFFVGPLCQDLTATARPLIERQVNGLLDSSTSDSREGERLGGRSSSSVPAGAWTIPQLSPRVSTSALDVLSPTSAFSSEAPLAPPPEIVFTQTNSAPPSSDQRFDLMNDVVGKATILPLSTTNVDLDVSADTTVKGGTSVTHTSDAMQLDAAVPLSPTVRVDQSDDDPFASVPFSNVLLEDNDPFASPLSGHPRSGAPSSPMGFSNMDPDI